MAYCDRPELKHYLTNFTGQDPIKSVTCAFVQDSGAGMGMEAFALVVFAAVGLGLTIRVQHPAPILVAGILSAGVITVSLPGAAAKVLALAIFFAIAGAALFLYQSAKNTM